MLIFKSFHIIAMVAWFAALFYLPRLFVYHASAADNISIERFILMENRLYYRICWPAALLTTLFGLVLLFTNIRYYLSSGWMHAKISMVLLLWAYHFACGHFLKQFARHINTKDAKFFRVFNEVPTVLLIIIVFLVVIKPF